VKLPGRNPTPEQSRTLAELAGDPNSAHVKVIRSYREGVDDLNNLYRLKLNRR
jgi:hypothetical protein